MTYTKAWRSTVPSRNAPKNTIDDEIRSLRLDFQERLNTVVSGVGSLASDPVIPLTASRFQAYHWSQFKQSAESPAGAVSPISTKFGLGAPLLTTTQYNLSISLPIGDVIQSIHLSSETTATGTIVWTVHSLETAAVPYVHTSIATGTLTATAQANTALVTAAALTITATKFYYVTLTLHESAGAYSDWGFQGVRVIYDSKPLVYV